MNMYMFTKTSEDHLSLRVHETLDARLENRPQLSATYCLTVPRPGCRIPQAGLNLVSAATFLAENRPSNHDS